MSTTRVLILWISLGPYHVARLNALDRMANIEVTCVQLSRGEYSREWSVTPDTFRFNHRTLCDGAYETSDKSMLACRVEQAAEELQPDVVVISGYSERPMRAAAKWARRHGRASILMSESHRLDRRRFGPKERVKGSWICRHFDAAFVGGERQAAYLTELGFPMARIWRGYGVVDNAHFSAETTRVRADAAAWRMKLGLPTRYFLYVGRLSPEKNLERLLFAFRAYRDRANREPWDLVLVGGGPLESKLKRIAVTDKMTGVFWPGFQQIDRLPAYYALASCLILPSRSEPWGLVVNEAMACGLPVLVSDRCGAAGDLVFPGINGYVFDPDSTEELTLFMARIATERVDLAAMGEASRSIIARYSLERWGQALVDCIAVTLDRAPLKKIKCASCT